MRVFIMSAKEASLEAVRFSALPLFTGDWGSGVGMQKVVVYVIDALPLKHQCATLQIAHHHSHGMPYRRVTNQGAVVAKKCVDTQDGIL